MIFDIPHLIATALAVFGIIWLVDHVGLRPLLTREFPRQAEARALMQRLSAAGGTR